MKNRPSKFLAVCCSAPLFGTAVLAMATACGGGSFSSGRNDLSSGGSNVGGMTAAQTSDTGGISDSGGAADSGGSSGELGGSGGMGASDSGGAGAGGNSSAGGVDTGAGGNVTTGGAAYAGGAANSGGNLATGGSAVVSACQQSSDCTICKYDRPVSNSNDCYCAPCPTTPLSRDQCDTFRNQWERYCSQVPMTCPAIACVSRLSATCSNGICSSLIGIGPG